MVRADGAGSRAPHQRWGEYRMPAAPHPRTPMPGRPRVIRTARTDAYDHASEIAIMLHGGGWKGEPHDDESINVTACAPPFERGAGPGHDLRPQQHTRSGRDERPAHQLPVEQ